MHESYDNPRIVSHDCLQVIAKYNIGREVVEETDLAKRQQKCYSPL